MESEYIESRGWCDDALFEELPKGMAREAKEKNLDRLLSLMTRERAILVYCECTARLLDVE